MKNENTINQIELNDDELEKVSGGSQMKAGTETKYCPRCKAPHKLTKYFNCTVKYNGIKRIAAKYVCGGLRSTDSTYKFYELEDNGTIILLDQFFNPIG